MCTSEVERQIRRWVDTRLLLASVNFRNKRQHHSACTYLVVPKVGAALCRR